MNLLILKLSEVCKWIKRSQMYDAFAGKKLTLLQTFPLMWSVHVEVLVYINACIM